MKQAEPWNVNFTEWQVYLDSEVVEEVFFKPSCSAEYVRDSLIAEGFNRDIVVENKHRKACRFSPFKERYLQSRYL